MLSANARVTRDGALGGEPPGGGASVAIESFDHLSIRCPKLGGSVTFEYCRTLNDGLPCGTVLGCWTGCFDVVSFLESNYSPEQLQRTLTARRGRMDLIREAVEQARKERE